MWAHQSRSSAGGIIQPGDTDALRADRAETSTPRRKETDWGTVPVNLLFWCETEEVSMIGMIFENALPAGRAELHVDSKPRVKCAPWRAWLSKSARARAYHTWILCFWSSAAWISCPLKKKNDRTGWWQAASNQLLVHKALVLSNQELQDSSTGLQQQLWSLSLLLGAKSI